MPGYDEHHSCWASDLHSNRSLGGNRQQGPQSFHIGTVMLDDHRLTSEAWPSASKPRAARVMRTCVSTMPPATFRHSSTVSGTPAKRYTPPTAQLPMRSAYAPTQVRQKVVLCHIRPRCGQFSAARIMRRCIEAMFRPSLRHSRQEMHSAHSPAPNALRMCTCKFRIALSCCCGEPQ